MIFLLTTLNSKINSSLAIGDSTILVKRVYFTFTTLLSPSNSDVYQ